MKTKDLRKMLASALDKALKGELSSEDGRNIIGLANQITANMATEVKVQILRERMGHQVDKFGDLDIT